MKKRVTKNIVSCVIFCVLLVLLLGYVSDILVPKSTNRYYILEKYLEENDQDFDVQVYGSCHSYTSFNPVYLEENYGVTGFVYGNAGEIIPTTYLRMREQFQEHTPEVALVEIWGVNPYETYSSYERVFGFYFQNNLERVPFSVAKLKVIQDFDTLDMQEMNFSIASYKDRVMDESLTNVDFCYSFEATEPYSSEYVFSEMTLRMTNNGFKSYPSTDIADYPEKQSSVSADDQLAVEADIVKYLDKIIALCEEYDVELIFYRAPYRSRENELRKVNWFYDYCDEQDVLFVDLETEIAYDYTTDFYDYEHLSETGANKSTAYLAEYILEAME